MKILNIVSIAIICAVVYTVFMVSREYPQSTVTAKEEYFTIVSALVSLLVIPFLVASKKLKFSLLDLLVLLFVGYTTANFYFHDGIEVSSLSMLLMLGVLYFNIRVIANFHKDFTRWFVLVLLVSGIAEALIGIRQIYGFAASNHSLFKATGTFFNPGPYAGYLAVVFSIAVVMVVKNYKEQMALLKWENLRDDYRRVLNLDTALFLVATIAIVSTFVVIPATMSRSAWLAVIVVATMMVLANNSIKVKFHHLYNAHKKRTITVLSLCVILLFILAVGAYHIKKGSADGRNFMWRMTTNVIKEQPITGVGLGYFASAYADTQANYFVSDNYREQDTKVAGNPAYAFNEYLHIGAEGGVIGLLLFSSIIYFTLANLFKTRPEIGAGLLALLVFAFSSYPFSILPLAIFFCVAVALGANDVGSGRSKVFFITICCTGLIFTSYMAIKSREKYTAYREWHSAQMLYKMELYNDIVADYDSLYAMLNDESEFLFEYGHLLNKIKEYAKSNEILLRGTKLSSDPMFFNIMGNNYKELGNYAMAEECYWKAYNIVPSRIYPLYLLVKMYYESGDTIKGKKVAVKLLATRPKVSSSATKEMQQEIQNMIK